ncbi:DUF541 domain-containing protein [Pusillimonas sp. TS35]|nr:DUF541 domain-containing protein [Pusillimonas sp. TS35]
MGKRLPGTISLLASSRLSAVLLALVVAAGITVAPGAHAEPDAQAHQRTHQKWPQATLQAQAVAEIAQDTVRITLATEFSDNSQATVAQALSETLEAVMKQAKGHAGIKATSGDYRIWPMNDQDGKISNWRGRGEIVLESKDFAAASVLAATLADRMPIAGLQFFVSPRARADKEQALLADAAQAFRDRAQAVSQAFGYAGYEIREVDLGGAGARYESAPAPRMMAMATADKQASVPLEPGTERVTVIVSGSIFLLKDKK